MRKDLVNVMKDFLVLQEKPLISILVPTYNRMPLLKDCIQSVLDQSYGNWELIIVNDGSDDSSLEYIASISDSRIKVLSFDRNLGRVMALNAGLQLCCGKYIARLDSDDKFLPRHLEVSVSFLLNHPKVVVLGSQMYLTGEDKNEKTQDPVGEDISFYFLKGNVVNSSTALISASLVKRKSLKYLESACEDYDLWVRLVKFGKIANLPVVGAVYLLHKGQVSKKVAPFLSIDLNRVRRKAASRFFYESLIHFDVSLFFDSVHEYTMAVLRISKLQTKQILK